MTARVARTIRRSLVVAGLAAIALVAALLWSQRSWRAPTTASVPGTSTPETTAAPAEAPPAPAASAPSEPAPPRRAEPAPAPREAVDLPARAPRQSPRALARQTEAPRAEPPPREEPSAMARAATPRPRSDVRVEVAQAASSGAVDYTVRVSWPDGAPMNDADVRVRGIMSDGGLVEARLDPGAEPGVYRGLLTFSPRGPRGLTVRVARGGAVVEVPVAAQP